MGSDYILSWLEGGQTTTIYFRASEDAATLIASALAGKYTEVSLTRQETVPHEVAFKGKKG